ncbi:hypothetical protein NDU88_004777 [Pleurodeles waltl]|uniref:Uncharacterized protein n=1 Tax=Pleurodeles waltl TaxID=8319 RepID=A0AAV7KYX7_PLEWA|nr:hypothetical protein NDU88_004777 [Pleurodeles waltl]
MLVALVAMRRLRKSLLGRGDSEEWVGHEDAVNNETVPKPVSVSKNNKKGSGASFKIKTKRKVTKLQLSIF